MVRIIMHGCNGKMGRVIAGMLEKDTQATIVAGVDPFATGSNAFPVYQNVGECDIEADVIIDFSNASAVDNLIDYSVDRNIPLVLCTTGLSPETINKVNEASKKVAILRSANMSLGINLLMKLLKDATKVLAPSGYDVEIVEKHHNLKLDAPSGTALALADSIKEELDDSYYYKYDRSSERKQRDPKEIGISALRGGTIVGEHEVFFAGIDEVIEFKHTAYSKSIFAKGAIEAAKFLAGKEAGLYNMQDVIG